MSAGRRVPPAVSGAGATRFWVDNFDGTGLIGDVPPGARVLLAVGPERGWEEPSELDMFAAEGFEAVTLGPRTLRTDVATISLLAIANEALRQHD